MGFIWQSQEEFDERFSAPAALAGFRAVQMTQGVMAVTLNIGLFVLVANHHRLQNRTYHLLCALAISDVLFGLYMTTHQLSSLAAGHPVPGGRPVCQVFGVFTVGPLVLSVESYAIIAYDRYKALVTPLDVVSERRLVVLWAGAALFALFVAIEPFFGLGGYRVGPAGLYCMYEGAVESACLLAVLVCCLGAVVVLYARTGAHLHRYMLRKQHQHLASTALPEEVAEAQKWAATARKATVRMAALPLFYCICWTPAVVSLPLQMFDVRSFVV